MKGNFTRDTFQPDKHYSRVLMQQGRVLLDADWNEQTAILQHYLRALGETVIGPFGGSGFEISKLPHDGAALNDLQIGKGTYFVRGILCENDTVDQKYSEQVGFLSDQEKTLPNLPFMVYLDVWERHVTYLEDGNESIRESALNGPDTCTRAQVVWQVRVLGPDPVPSAPAQPETKKLGWVTANINAVWEATTYTALRDALIPVLGYSTAAGALNPPPSEYEMFEEFLARYNFRDATSKLLSNGTARLKAYLTDPDELDQSGDCIISPDVGYRGLENQLYRVEIHDGGTKDSATFKWSRDNGAVVAKWIESKPGDPDGIRLSHTRGFEGGPYQVESIADTSELRGGSGTMYSVKYLEGDTLVLAEGTTIPTWADNLRIRRWESAAVPVNEYDRDAAKNESIQLENGLAVQFYPPSDDVASVYRPGDYWLIPARVATGEIEWALDSAKKDSAEPSERALAQEARGTKHYYAPLALVRSTGGGGISFNNLRNDPNP